MLRRGVLAHSVLTACTLLAHNAEDKKQLTSRIKHAASWKELQAALAMAREHEHELDCIALTSFFSALPRVLKRYQKLGATEMAEVRESDS